MCSVPATVVSFLPVENRNEGGLGLADRKPELRAIVGSAAFGERGMIALEGLFTRHGRVAVISGMHSGRCSYSTSVKEWVQRMKIAHLRPFE